jgi:hypothetical protein
MSSLWDAVSIQVLGRTGPLMLNLSGTPDKIYSVVHVPYLFVGFFIYRSLIPLFIHSLYFAYECASRIPLLAFMESFSDLPPRSHIASLLCENTDSEAVLVLIGCTYYFMTIPGKRVAPGTSPGFHLLEPVVQWKNPNTQTTAVRDQATKRRNTKTVAALFIF